STRPTSTTRSRRSTRSSSSVRLQADRWAATVKQTAVLGRCATAALIAVLTACHAAPKPVTAPSSPARLKVDATSASALVRDIDAILAQPALQHGSWGVLVK